MTAPVRLQLSRQRGFDLQAVSIATNGLPAVAVARPHKWGNPFAVADAIESGFAADDAGARAFVVECFRDWIGPSQSGRDWWQGPEADMRRAAFLGGFSYLRGKNLACWCKPGAPCHADVLLELANAPICEEIGR